MRSTRAVLTVLTERLGTLEPSEALVAICRALLQGSLPVLRAGSHAPTDLLMSVVFLRVISPALVQCDTLGGVTRPLLPHVSKALLRTAKQLQLMANGMEVTEAGEAELEQWTLLGRRLRAISRLQATLARPPESLERAAIDLYRVLETMGVPLTLGPTPLSEELVDGRPRLALELDKRLANVYPTQ